MKQRLWQRTRGGGLSIPSNNLNHKYVVREESPKIRDSSVPDTQNFFKDRGRSCPELFTNNLFVYPLGTSFSTDKQTHWLSDLLKKRSGFDTKISPLEAIRGVSSHTPGEHWLIEFQKGDKSVIKLFRNVIFLVTRVTHQDQVKTMIDRYTETRLTLVDGPVGIKGYDILLFHRNYQTLQHFVVLFVTPLTRLDTFI